MSGRPHDPNEGLPGFEPDVEPSDGLEQDDDKRPPEQDDADPTAWPDSPSTPADDEAEAEQRDRVERNDLDYEDLPGLEGMSTYDLTADWSGPDWRDWFAREVDSSSLWKRFRSVHDAGHYDDNWEEIATNPATGKPDPDLMAAQPALWDEDPFAPGASPTDLYVAALAFTGSGRDHFAALSYEKKVKFYKGWYRVTEAAAAQETRDSETPEAESKMRLTWSSKLTKSAAAVGGGLLLAGLLLQILGGGSSDDQVATATTVLDDQVTTTTVFLDDPTNAPAAAGSDGEASQRLSPLLIDPCAVISGAAIEGFAGSPVSEGASLVSPSDTPFDPEKTRRASCQFATESDTGFGLWVEVQRGEDGFFSNFQERYANAVAADSVLGFGDFGEVRVLPESKSPASGTLYEGTYVALQVHYLDESQTGGVFILVASQPSNADAPYPSTAIQESTVRGVAGILWDELVAAQRG